MNQGKWDSLSAEQQDVVAKAGEQYCLDIRSLIREDVEEMTQKMVEEGCEVIEVSDQLDKDMRAAAEKVWADDEATKTFDQEAVARIREEAGLK